MSTNENDKPTYSAQDIFYASVKIGKWHFAMKVISILLLFIGLFCFILGTITFENGPSNLLTTLGIIELTCALGCFFWTDIILGAKVVVRAAEIETHLLTKNNSEIKDLYEYIEKREKRE